MLSKLFNLFKKKPLELTEWYQSDVNPVHIGVYQLKVLNTDQYFYGYWNGSYWCIEGKSEPLIFQYRPWRGIKK